LTNWADIANASGTWLAVKTDGTLWACGSNSSGSAGQNNLIGYSSPVQIGSDTDWSKVFGGGNNWWAIKTDGTLYACGYNLSGRLGDNTIINRSSPVQIGSGTWSLVSGMGQVFAVSTAGELWVWGNEPKGEAGLNTRDRDRSSPVQVGALTNWNGDIAAVSEASYAVKEDGTLWSWGSAQNGRLGNNSTTVSRSSPVQVGALATWSKVTGGGTGTAAVKTDGTLWGWGENSGQYRINNLTFASSPVQTGSDTDWFDVTMPRNSANDRTILITKLA
jgi:alpha-tubulin suppressor-like RCC1 family protein